jgi:hypothetical protein
MCQAVSHLPQSDSEIDQETVARMIPFLVMRRSISTPPCFVAPAPEITQSMDNTPPSPATPVRASVRATRGRPRGGGAPSVQFTPPSAPVGRGRGRGRASPSPAPVDSNIHILVTSPLNMGTTTSQVGPVPVTPAQQACFDAQFNALERDSAAEPAFTDFMRTSALREDAEERARFVNAARNLFPDPHGQATPCPRTPLTPGRTYDPADLYFQNTPATVNVTANPFFGVRVSAPELDRAASRPPMASPSFIETPDAAKENQLFSVPTVELLESILKETFELRFLDKMQLAIITEIRELITRYSSMISMVADMASVNPAFFKLLGDYKSKMVRKLRVLTSSPVSSAAQRAMVAPLIHFMSEYSDTKGFGTIFPIKEFRKPKPYAAEYRSSFRDNSGVKPSSSYKPDNFNRKKDDSNSYNGGGRAYYGRPREDNYSRIPRGDKDRKPAPYNGRGRF